MHEDGEAGALLISADRILRANDDAEFALAARFLDARLRLEAGDQTVTVTITRGRVVDIGDADATCDIRIAGPADGWREMLAKTPKPFYQDLWGAMLHHGFSVDGDVELSWQYNPAIRRLIELLRDA